MSLNQERTSVAAAIDEEPCPLFLFSVTRSGSTLVQRVLASHDEIATRSEPWLLLPQIYALRDQGVSGDYTPALLARALHEFASQLPRGLDDYLDEVRAFALNLYARASEPGATYFLDKSPPYALIVEDIIRLFPNGKFIFLWRNPLSVVASIIETWQGGRWKPETFRSDLFIGIQNLTAAYERHAAEAVSVRYEDLIVSEDAWRKVADYLEIEFDRTSLTRFADLTFEGSMGDQVGTRDYSAIEESVAAKWRRTICNPLRKTWCIRYLRWVGARRLGTMGYDMDDLMAQLTDLPAGSKHLTGDALRLANALLREPIRQRARKTVDLRGPSVLRLLMTEPSAPAEPAGS